MLCLSHLDKKREAQNAAAEVERFLNNSANTLSDIQIEYVKRQLKIFSSTSFSYRDPSELPGSNDLKNLPIPIIAVSYGNSKQLTNTSNRVTLKYSSESGRGLVANAALIPSDVLIVDDPFAMVIVGDSILTRCNNCLVRFSNFIPCRRCSDVRYCSVHCEESAWRSYHVYECGFYDVLSSMEIGHLVYRTISMTHHNVLKDVKRSMAVGTFDINNSAMMIDSQSFAANYDTVCSMKTHFNNASPELIDMYTNIVAVMVSILPKDFFDLELTKVYIASVMMFHMFQFPCNVHSLSETIYDDSNPNLELFSNKKYGMGIFTITSLMNHSCDPNVAYVNEGEIMVARCIKPIGLGEELFVSYGPKEYKMSTEERRLELMKQYHFICKCQICMKPDTNPVLNERQKFQMNALAERFKKINLATATVEEAEFILDSRKNILPIKSIEIGESYDMLAQIMVLKGDVMNGMIYAFKSLNLIGVLYGKTSVEYGHEMEKVAGLYYEIGDLNKSLSCYTFCRNIYIPYYGSTNYKIHRLNMEMDSIEDQLLESTQT